MLALSGSPRCAPLMDGQHHRCPARHTAFRAACAWQQWHERTQCRDRLCPQATATATVRAPPPPLQRNDSLDRSSALSLVNIRDALIRQEDTIIFSLIERAQFARNDKVYRPEGVPVPGFSPSGQRMSLLEYLLRDTEHIHGKIRRFTSPDEHAFYPDDVPPLVLPPMTFPEVLAPCARGINVNKKILALYLGHLLPGITQPGDDNNYGSSAMYDVLALQALSKRIHYGKFVAEAKFLAHTEEYSRLIHERDAAGIMRLLTDTAVEQKVLERVRRKAALFGQDVEVPEGWSASADEVVSRPQAAAVSNAQQLCNASSATAGTGQVHELHSSDERWQASPAAGAGRTADGSEGVRFKVRPDVVAELYERWVMPLTKEVEVAYLLRRLDHTPKDTAM